MTKLAEPIWISLSEALDLVVDATGADPDKAKRPLVDAFTEGTIQTLGRCRSYTGHDSQTRLTLAWRRADIAWDQGVFHSPSDNAVRRAPHKFEDVIVSREDVVRWLQDTDESTGDELLTSDSLATDTAAANGWTITEASKMARGFGDRRFPGGVLPFDENDPKGMHPLTDRLVHGDWHATGFWDQTQNERDIPPHWWKFLIPSAETNTALGNGREIFGVRIFNSPPPAAGPVTPKLSDVYYKLVIAYAMRSLGSTAPHVGHNFADKVAVYRKNAIQYEKRLHAYRASKMAAGNLSSSWPKQHHRVDHPGEAPVPPHDVLNFLNDLVISKHSIEEFEGAVRSDIMRGRLSVFVKSETTKLIERVKIPASIEFSDLVLGHGCVLYDRGNKVFRPLHVLQSEVDAILAEEDALLTEVRDIADNRRVIAEYMAETAVVEANDLDEALDEAVESAEAHVRETLEEHSDHVASMMAEMLDLDGGLSTYESENSENGVADITGLKNGSRAAHTLNNDARRRGGEHHRHNRDLQEAVGRIADDLRADGASITLTTVWNWLRENAADQYEFDPIIPGCDFLQVEGDTLYFKDQAGRENKISRRGLERYLARAKRALSAD